MSDFKPKFTQDGEEHCESTEAAMVRIMARYNLHRAVCEELIAEVQESFAGGGDDLRSEFWKLRGLIERGFLHQKRYYAKNGGCRDLSEACLWVLLGFNSIVGCDTMPELSKKFNKSKQAVNKCLRHFQAELPELPELSGQREFESVEKMKRAQKEIWHKLSKT